MVKMTNQIGLVQTVAQCIKDAEGTIKRLKNNTRDCEANHPSKGQKEAWSFSRR